MKIPSTNIDVIENYYAKLNLNLEVSNLEYQTEYRRLWDSITKVLRHKHIPPQEFAFVTHVLEGRSDSHDPVVLYKLS